jgi:hypothetical protein
VLKEAGFLEREVTRAAVGQGAHDEVIEQLNLHDGGGQAHRAGQASVRIASGGILAASIRVVGRFPSFRVLPIAIGKSGVFG